MKQIKEIPDVTEWMAKQEVEIHVQVDAGWGRVIDTTFFSVEELESRLNNIEASIKKQLEEDYNDEVASIMEHNEEVREEELNQPKPSLGEIYFNGDEIPMPRLHEVEAD